MSLYSAGKTLREVAEQLHRSHEWVRKALKQAGGEARNRGREPESRPVCGYCEGPCPKLTAKFCSRDCLAKHRHDTAMEKLQEALKVIRRGGSYSEAAKAAGFPNAWHLWGRLHHFGLTGGLEAPRKP